VGEADAADVFCAEGEGVGGRWGFEVGCGGEVAAAVAEGGEHGGEAVVSDKGCGEGLDRLQRWGFARAVAEGEGDVLFDAVGCAGDADRGDRRAVRVADGDQLCGLWGSVAGEVGQLAW
jgi:hypothetical protein